jgi:sulfite exporter TauE/SafE
LLDQFKTYYPFAFFLIGFSGSAHCLGMCGPLILASAKNKKENFIYHVGRLSGYLSLSLIFSLISLELIKKYQSKMIFGAAIFIAILFFISGLKLLFKLNLGFQISIYQKLIQKLLSKSLRFSKKSSLTSLFTGFFSAFLPCGLLYTAILSSLSFLDLKTSLLSILFFFTGTLPALLLAPTLIQKLIRPYSSKLPVFSGILLISLGFYFLTQRSSMEIKIDKSNASVFDTTCHN